MQIILARTAGFCMGVKRAMERVLTIARRNSGPIFTYGPLIHNRQAVNLLESRGIRAATDFRGIPAATVLLRTHGVPPQTVAELQAAGLDVQDGTCPHVLRGQRSIRKQSADGYEVIIVGDSDHDEVVGLAGYAAGPCRIIATVAEAHTVPLGEKTLVVAQTTFSESLFGEITDVLRARKPDIEILNSICNATSLRQHEARELARKVDAMVVVGGYHSANTQRLVQVAAETGTPTFHVETADELDVEQLAQYDTIGVTAGASTPSWITSTVIERLRRTGERQSLLARLKGLLERVVIDGNLLVAAGAAAVTFAAGRLMHLQLPRWQQATLMIAACSYIFSIYSFARKAESESVDLADTRRGAFSKAHPIWLTAISALLSIASFILLGLLGPTGLTAVLLFAACYILAGAYIIILARKTPPDTFPWNIPASKDLLSAAGWVGVTVLIPVAAAGGHSMATVAAVAAFVFGMAFMRSVMFDFSDVMADRLLGRDTLPALIGIRPARFVLGLVSIALAAILFAGSFAGRIDALGFWMLLCPAYALSYVLILGRAASMSERRTAVLVDGAMILAGLITLAYALLY